MIILLAIFACTKSIPPVQPAAAGEDSGAPIDSWLAGSTWHCDAVAGFGATRIEVAHTWSFTDTEFTTDLPTMLASAANAEAIPYAGAYAFSGWVEYDGSKWVDDVIDTTDRHWFGVGERTILLEMITESAPSGIPYAFSMDRYEGADGTTRLTMGSSNALQTGALDCAQVE